MSDTKGQMSIFLAVVTVIIIGLMAFVINVGIFVKAKINLQNAVDAAAYSGAAVQARQLTNIAYMNWAMRNIYKEWMFKYYVLGQLGNRNTKAPFNGGGRMDFRLPSLRSELDRVGVNDPSVFNEAIYKKNDPWNIPSVCIEYAGRTPICDTYSQPGLPKFSLTGMPGTDEIFRTFTDLLSSDKAKNCSERTKLNFLSLVQWTYGVGTGGGGVPSGNAPAIAFDRVGAFPLALEAAMRVRNLERIVNEAPKKSVTAQSIGGLEGNEVPIHERTVKAFWAGYRNLNMSPDGEPNNLKETFTLSELTPRKKPMLASSSNLSGYLIRDGVVDGKHYLDLQLMLVNYAVFFNLLASRNTTDPNASINVSTASGATHSVSACGVRKTAIPVPGYPLGFVKNPRILTYYAVKGEALFTGLMSPFVWPIRMVAYAAAKPFGGRIGPHLFKIDDGGKYLKPRGEISASFLIGLKAITAVRGSNAATGSHPIPVGDNFWLTGIGDEVVGGAPGSAPGRSVKFAIPNMPYNFVPTANPNGFTFNPPGATFQVAEEYPSPVSQPPDSKESAGLYAEGQFKAFKSPTLRGNAVGAAQTREGIAHALKPQHYEAANYLIPSLEDHNKAAGIWSIGPLAVPLSAGEGSGDTRRFRIEIYAPLFGPGLLYSGPDDLTSTLENYFSENEPAIMVYLAALKRIAVYMAGADPTVYMDAAKSIHIAAEEVLSRDAAHIEGIVNDGSNIPDNTCESVAGKFTYLYLGRPGRRASSDRSQCLQPLKESLVKHWEESLGRPRFANYFQLDWYVLPEGVDEKGEGIGRFMSGYMPGELQGATNDEEANENSGFELVSEEKSHRRNHYSVKFVPLKSLLVGSDASSYEKGTLFSLLGEGMDSLPTSPDDLPRIYFKNELEEGVEIEKDVEH